MNKKNIGILVAGMEAACKVHGVRGFLEHDTIEKIKNSLDPDEIPARIYGKFMHLQGLVFKEFKRSVHVIKPFEINPIDFAVYMALDPHPRTEDAVLWVAVSRDNVLYVVDELFEHNTIDELVHKIKAIEDMKKYRIVRRLIDPSAKARDQHSEYSLLDELSQKGLYFELGTKERDLATRKIKDMIHWEGTENNITKKPQIYFFFFF